MNIAERSLRGLSALAILGRGWRRRVRAGALTAARRIRCSRLGRLHWRRGVISVLVSTTIVAATLVAGGIYYVCFDRTNLPDLEAFSRFELPTIGHVYDVNDRPLVEMASEYRQITRYEDIPPVVRDAILAAEDKNFFSHSGVDYAGLARVLCKLRIRNLALNTQLGRGIPTETTAGWRKSTSTACSRSSSLSTRALSLSLALVETERPKSR